MHVRSHEKLIVWQEAYSLSLSIYKCTATFPGHELYVLVSQIRRAAYSVPANIAEGNTRRTSANKKRFFAIALASLDEVHVFLLLSRDLQYMTEAAFEQHNKALQRVGFLLTKLRASV